jgi:hypothetical protein
VRVFTAFAIIAFSPQKVATYLDSRLMLKHAGISILTKATRRKRMAFL